MSKHSRPSSLITRREKTISCNNDSSPVRSFVIDRFTGESRSPSRLIQQPTNLAQTIIERNIYIYFLREWINDAREGARTRGKRVPVFHIKRGSQVHKFVLGLGHGRIEAGGVPSRQSPAPTVWHPRHNTTCCVWDEGRKRRGRKK